MSSRRGFLEGVALGGLASLAGVPDIASAQPLGPTGLEVLRFAVHAGRRLREGALSPTEWQDEVESILRTCTVADLAEAIDLPALRRRARPVARGASILRVPVFDRLSADEGADVKIFFLRRGRADPPHVHFNLVAAHIVLEGQFRVRHFDRVREEDGGFVLRGTQDRVLGAGQVSSISDLRDNGHWHLAQTDGVLLDVQQGRIDPSLPVRRREMIDPDRPAARDDGSFYTRRLTRNAALRRYG